MQQQISFKAENQINKHINNHELPYSTKNETWESLYIDRDPNHMFNSCQCIFLNIFQASFSVNAKV
jgi:hypothetical protein